MSDEKFQNKYRIKSARATWHDYNGGAYFITVCTKNREHFFGEIVQSTMQLSPIGQILCNNLQNVTIHYPYAEIPLFVVMPNHWHAIVFVDGENCRDVSRLNGKDVSRYVSTGETAKNKKMVEIAKHQSLLSWTIRGIKTAIKKYANENGIEFAWQTRFHDRIIRDKKMMNTVADYIENNVARWDNDCFNMPM
ncbi:hypothetical protein FACS189446_2160 [Bacteroidia bacterium]|nr:hypothetical protein FACS189446_2160 [Bacteroidia bacterium]